MNNFERLLENKINRATINKMEKALNAGKSVEVLVDGGKFRSPTWLQFDGAEGNVIFALDQDGGENEIPIRNVSEFRIS